MTIRDEIVKFHQRIRDLSDTELERKIKDIYAWEKKGVIESEELREDIDEYSRIIESPFHVALISYPQLIYKEASKRYLAFLNGTK